MLKLPKGLKKKKKKSKKDQELFTEEELEQYKREQKLKQQQLEQQNQENQENSGASGTENNTEQKSDLENSSAGAAAASAQHQQQQQQSDEGKKPKSEEDEEWLKFKQLTAGVDTILHKTQDELGRIKQESYYQRLPTEVEKKKQEEEEAKKRELERLEEERRKKEEEEANRDKLAEAVVELSESEEESEEVDDIFATNYIDAITSGEIQLAVVPDSPEFEDTGPDPFDTGYVENVIVGPATTKTGKKLVSLGAAVEVLSGRVDREKAVALSGAKKKQRRGITNLLLEDEEEAANLPEDLAVTPEPPKTLLDELEDDILDLPTVDLSVSLHLALQPKSEEPKDGETENNKNTEVEEETTKVPEFDLSEFDTLKDDEDDEFAELAVESLHTKKEEVKVITKPQPLTFSGEVEANWAEFEFTEEELKAKAKPPRPPRPAVGPSVPNVVENLSDDEFNIPEDDPFDTAFVEQVIVDKKDNDDDEDDFDFDPRAGEENTEAKKVTKEDIFANLAGAKPTETLLVGERKDLLGGSNTNLAQSPIAPAQESVDVVDEDYDPFDTSSVAKIVQPKETELKLIEKDLLKDTKLKQSLSDPDFDPRAGDPPTEEIKPKVSVPIVETEFDTARRKSSLSLSLQTKTVGFLVPNQSSDLLGANGEGGKIQKPLTPYYAHPESIAENKETEDPFDTSFVPSAVPSDIELKHIEKDLIAATLKHSLSDPDFDPRAFDEPEAPKPAEDLLAVEDNYNIKVLTPKLEDRKQFITENIEDDPFDTSIASNIAPGQTELRLLENELLPPTTPEITTGVLDTLTDAQELGLGDKVLTPRANTPIKLEEEEDIDPFDTSFAVNLGPGQAEIKVLESELIERKY